VATDKVSGQVHQFLLQSRVWDRDDTPVGPCKIGKSSVSQRQLCKHVEPQDESLGLIEPCGSVDIEQPST